MARIKGAKNFHLASVSENTDTTYTVGTPSKEARLISIEIENKVDSDTVYSDDEVEEDIYGAIQTSGKIKINYLTPELQLKLFGGKIDADGVYFPPSSFQVKHQALGFEAPTSGKGSKYVWYYDVVFELPSFKAETAEDKPKTQDVELSFKAYKNKKLDTHYTALDMNCTTANPVVVATWFTAVRVAEATTVTV